MTSLHVQLSFTLPLETLKTAIISLFKLLHHGFGIASINAEDVRLSPPSDGDDASVLLKLLDSMKLDVCPTNGITNITAATAKDSLHSLLAHCPASLKQLSLYRCSLPASTLSSLQKYRNLELLELNDFVYSSTDMARLLRAMPRLKVLSLGQEGVTVSYTGEQDESVADNLLDSAALRAVGDLKLLHTLRLNGTPVVASHVPQLAALSSLRTLELWSCPSIGHPHVADQILSTVLSLTALRSLKFRFEPRAEQVPASFLKRLTSLPSLSSLTIAAETSAEFKAVALLTRLTHLSVLPTNFVEHTVEVAFPVRQMNHLRELELRLQRFVDGVMLVSHLTNLESLSMSARVPFFNKNIAQRFGRMTQLKKLALYGPYVGREALRNLVVDLKGLKCLSLEESLVSKHELLSILWIPKLRKLDLSGCRGVTREEILELVDMFHKVHDQKLTLCV